MTVTDLNSRDPLSDSVFTAPAIHDARAATSAKKCIASVLVCCLA